mgnify:CR=1 FL=1
MEPNVVTKVVTDELSITTRFINGLKELAMTRGIDFLEALIIFIIGYIICRYIRRAVAHILEKSEVDPSAKTFIEEIIFFFCLAIVVLVALGTAGVGTGTLAAAFGGMGLAIGLGLKDNIGNVASGIFILIFRPFRVGDYIQVASNQGTVTEISIMYTMLSTLGNQRIVIPNSSLTSSVIKNFSAYDTRNLEMTFDVGYDTDLKSCVALLKKVFTEDAYVDGESTIAISAIAYKGSEITAKINGKSIALKEVEGQLDELPVRRIDRCDLVVFDDFHNGRLVHRRALALEIPLASRDQHGGIVKNSPFYIK